MQLNGSEIVIECLKEQGVDTVFGYPGGTILNIYDALYKHSNEITHYLTSHEQGAAHAADGYARATGKVGVCLATSGPGATNLVTGIATAYMDSVPLVAITANVGVNLLGKDTFQEVDIAGVAMPVTKYSVIVKDITKLADTIRRAFQIAQTGRPGPVLVDITKDVTANVTEYTREEPKPIKRIVETIKEEDLKVAAELISQAKKPYIFIGGGVNIADASEEARKFAEKIQAPVCDTLMGKGAYPGTGSLYTGMLGMHGTKTSNHGVTECDLLIALGARFSDRVTGNTQCFAKNAKILHIDVDAAEINKNVAAHASVIGDVKEILMRLLPMLEEKQHEEWLSYLHNYENKFPLTYEQGQLTGPAIIEEIYKQTEGNAIITTDVGQHQMWASQYYRYKESRTFLTSGGLGTMGYGLGACIGAQIARPEKQVINIAGDGCFRMNMNELATASRYQLPLIQVIINNHVLGMVRQWQTLFYGKRYSSTILNDTVDFVKVSEGLGAKAYRVTTIEELQDALKAALAEKGPVVLDCVIDCDDKVFPMAGPGAPIEECFDAEDIKSGKVNFD